MSNYGIGAACIQWGVDRSSKTPQVWGGHTDGCVFPKGDVFIFSGEHDGQRREVDGAKKMYVNLYEPKDRNKQRLEHIAELRSGTPGRVLFGDNHSTGKWVGTRQAKPWLVVRVLPVGADGITWAELERLP